MLSFIFGNIRTLLHFGVLVNRGVGYRGMRFADGDHTSSLGISGSKVCRIFPARSLSLSSLLPLDSPFQVKSKPLAKEINAWVTITLLTLAFESFFFPYSIQGF